MHHVHDRWVASCEKVPNVLSRCHPKRRIGARGCAHPFGMTPTFYKKKKRKEKEKSIINTFKKVGVIQKKDWRGRACPSFFWYDNDSGHWGPLRMTDATQI